MAAAIFGFASVAIFALAFGLFAVLNPAFDPGGDYISKLGASGQPYAIYWNCIGFGLVGAALAAFGWSYGAALGDRVLGACLLLAGLGCATAAVPTDLADGDSPMAKAHYASICFALMGWCFALARLLYAKTTDAFSRRAANGAVALAILPLVGVGAGISGEPLAQRLLLVVAFGWVFLSSVRMPQPAADPAVAG